MCVWSAWLHPEVIVRVERDLPRYAAVLLLQEALALGLFVGLVFGRFKLLSGTSRCGDYLFVARQLGFASYAGILRIFRTGGF